MKSNGKLIGKSTNSAKPVHSNRVVDININNSNNNNLTACSSNINHNNNN